MGASVVRADESGNAETARSRQTSLIYVLAAEFSESFAYWGVMSLLVLYMRKQLLVTRDFHAIFGLQPIIDLTTNGHVSVARVASAIFGLFTGFAMLTPIAGGLIADRWLGRTRTIALGAAFMAAGHVLLTFRDFPTYVESVPARSPARPPTLYNGQGGRAGERAGTD